MNVMADGLIDFYSSLTPFYHLLYPDWEKSMVKQAAMLDVIIHEYWSVKDPTILDAACGIGTQSLGLTSLGYSVTASDLSPHAVERAKQEASKRNLSLSFSVADMRYLAKHHADQYDIVIACDNAIPHLLSDDEILGVFREFHACTRPGGGCIISVRDYEAEEKIGHTTKVYGSREEFGTTYLIFQYWDWKGELYDLSLYFIEDEGRPQCITHVMRSKYYAVGTTKLIELMTEAGFHDVARLDEMFFQPIIIGTKKA
jgi:SAM-dependent methyltransferase